MTVIPLKNLRSLKYQVVNFFPPPPHLFIFFYAAPNKILKYYSLSLKPCTATEWILVHRMFSLKQIQTQRNSLEMISSKCNLDSLNKFLCQL